VRETFSAAGYLVGGSRFIAEGRLHLLWFEGDDFKYLLRMQTNNAIVPCFLQMLVIRFDSDGSARVSASQFGRGG
jgi:hypothetical protein